jgi:hypothetical protein
MLPGSELVAKPVISARIVAPRSMADSRDSRRRMPLPSPQTMPSRSRSNGRGVVVGAALNAVEAAFMMSKVAEVRG